MRFSVLLTFYRSFAFPALIVTVISCGFRMAAPQPEYIIPLFFTKVMTNGLLGVLFYFFSSDKLYFYFNLGYTTTRLYTMVFLADFLIWLVLITFSSLIG